MQLPGRIACCHDIQQKCRRPHLRGWKRGERHDRKESGATRLSSHGIKEQNAADRCSDENGMHIPVVGQRVMRDNAAGSDRRRSRCQLNQMEYPSIAMSWHLLEMFCIEGLLSRRGTASHWVLE